MDLKEHFKDIFEPVKYVDSKIHRNYNKIGDKLNINEGKIKYAICMGLAFTGNLICASTEIGYFLDFPMRSLIDVPDFFLNYNGLSGITNDDSTSDTKTEVHPTISFSKNFNSKVRLPTFLGGVGLVGKFGLDLVKYFTSGEPMDDTSYQSLRYGLGLISLASSMYIKDTDPKVLEKDPMWKDALNLVKNGLEKIKEEIPAFNPTYGFIQLEDRI